MAAPEIAAYNIKDDTWDVTKLPWTVGSTRWRVGVLSSPRVDHVLIALLLFCALQGVGVKLKELLKSVDLQMAKLPAHTHKEVRTRGKMSSD